MLHSRLGMAHGSQSIQASQDGTKEISDMKNYGNIEIFDKCESAQFQQSLHPVYPLKAPDRGAPAMTKVVQLAYLRQVGQLLSRRTSMYAHPAKGPTFWSKSLSAVPSSSALYHKKFVKKR